MKDDRDTIFLFIVALILIIPAWLYAFDPHAGYWGWFAFFVFIFILIAVDVRCGVNIGSLLLLVMLLAYLIYYSSFMVYPFVHYTSTSFFQNNNHKYGLDLIPTSPGFIELLKSYEEAHK